MKILFTGKNGQVGFELQRALAPLGEVIAVGHAECDLAQSDTIRQLVRETKPDIIVNSAAYTAVDKAETDQDLATAVNAIALGVFGEEALRLGALVIHYSTDPTMFLMAKKQVPTAKTTSPTRKAFTAKQSARAKLHCKKAELTTLFFETVGSLALMAATSQKPCSVWPLNVTV